MPLFRRSPAVSVELVTDLALDDVGLRRARDGAVWSGRWEPAADLLASTGADPDRRGAVVNALAAAAVQRAPWLDDWRVARPEDPGVVAVAAWALVQRAWDARGGGWAQDTEADGVAAFFRLLEDALPIAERACRAAPNDPTPWVVLIWLGIGREDPRAVLDERWAELVRRDPHNRLGHVARLQCLTEKWYGSHEEMYAFARSVSGPAWAPVVPVQAHAEFALKESAERRLRDVTAFWRSAQVAADLDRALDWVRAGRPGHAFALHDLSIVAYGLSQAERWSDAATVFAVTGPRTYEYPWYYLSRPAQTAARAYAAATAQR